jgi:hypothetical protein
MPIAREHYTEAQQSRQRRDDKLLEVRLRAMHDLVLHDW